MLDYQDIYIAQLFPPRNEGMYGISIQTKCLGMYVPKLKDKVGFILVSYFIEMTINVNGSNFCRKKHVFVGKCQAPHTICDF